MKRLRPVAIGLLFLAAGVSQARAGETWPSDLALRHEAQSRLAAQATSANVQKGNGQYALLAERRQVDEMIAALEAGKDIAPERIERALKRTRVLQ